MHDTANDFFPRVARSAPIGRSAGWSRFLAVFVFLVVARDAFAQSDVAAPVHVWEKVEITLRAKNLYKNPYTDVRVWATLTGPGFEKRCYGFWDGGDIFRLRIAATSPGAWHWQTGSQPVDSGLSGKRGTFTAVPWTEAEKQANVCRRGMVRSTPTGHAFESADGTPFFLVGDTWWATPTFRYRWVDDDKHRVLGPQAGFKDYVRYRLKQGYNCVAMIAAFPHWHNDGKPSSWNMEDGTVIRAAWRQAGTKSAKTMTDEHGERPFLFPGKVPDYENAVPDLERINPAYFQAMDRKIDYLNAHGMMPFIEVARRDIGQVWKKFYPWPSSYTGFIQYVWSRYQANLCFFSPIHFDTPRKSIAAKDWNEAANNVIRTFGLPPFSTLVGTNANPSSLRNWGHVDKAVWLGFHQIGNRRTHDCYAFLTEIFQAEPPLPGLNGEPYYDGMEKAEPGSEMAALYCRSAMYGSVLSGGLAGHIYGAGGWKGGMWSGEVEAASPYPIWSVIQWPSGDQMRHLKTFVLSEGRRYQDLIPAVDLISPNKSSGPRTNVGWAYCAGTAKKDFFLAYFERDCRKATISGVRPETGYRFRWFNPRTGRWLDTSSDVLDADAAGKIDIPPFPGGNKTCGEDWGLKLTLATYCGLYLPDCLFNNPFDSIFSPAHL